MISELRRVCLRLLSFLRPGRADRELDRELAAHLAMLEDDYRRRGLEPAAAAAAAERALGGVLRVKDSQRDARSFIWLEDARMDARFAARTLLKTPGFTALTVLTLALGVGSVTVIWSLIHDVLLDPLPYRGSERLVTLQIRDADTGWTRGVFPADEFLDLEAQSDVFEDVIGPRGETILLTTPQGTEALRGVRVTPNFFEAMGLAPLLGRTFSSDDAGPDAPAVAVLRHRAYVRYFGADPGTVGRSIHLGGEPHTVVGVMAPRFTWHAADVWILDPLTRGDSDERPRNFQGRLREGVTREQAEAQLKVIARRRAQLFPGQYPEHFDARIVNVIDQVVGDFRGVLVVALAAVVALLVIACSNVASMLLARATAREHEMSVRVALGAGRARIVRQLAVESLLLALLAGVIGAGLAYAGVSALVRFIPEGPLPGEVDLALDPSSLAVCLGIACLAAVLSGLAPAVYVARRDVADGLTGGGRAVAGQGASARNALVAAQIALSLALVLGAGLLMRTFVSLISVDLGFSPKNILAGWVVFPPHYRDDPDAPYRVYERALPLIESLPGVEAAAAATDLPPFDGGYRVHLEVPGLPREERPLALLQVHTGDYFQAVGIRMLRGRPARRSLEGAAQSEVVVDEGVVRSFFGSDEVLSHQMSLVATFSRSTEPKTWPVEIVGVAQRIQNGNIRVAPVPQVYMPFRPGSGLYANGLLVRTSGDPLGSVEPVRRIFAEVDRGTALLQPEALDTLIQRRIYAQPRFSLLVVVVFAASAMLLVAAGVFGVMAYTVSRQTREIAVRMALGARPRRILAVVLGLGCRVLIVGLAVGIVASLAVSRVIESQLWNTSPYDPFAFAAAIAAVSFVVLAACAVPARRAMRVGLMEVLRED